MVKPGSRPIAAAWSAQQPRPDGVEGARPGQRSMTAAGAPARGGDPLDPPRHLGRGPAAEGQQQDAAAGRRR
jgi:hypothetical protein